MIKGSLFFTIFLWLIIFGAIVTMIGQVLNWLSDKIILFGKCVIDYGIKHDPY